MDICFAIAAYAYASKVEIHHTLYMSPGAQVFQRDMIINITLITDLLQPHKQKQIFIDEGLQQAYLCCRTFDYKHGDKI